jgi:hypothetical protein
MNILLIAAFAVTGGVGAAVIGGTARIAIRARLHQDDPTFRPRAVAPPVTSQLNGKVKIGATS